MFVIDNPKAKESTIFVLKTLPNRERFKYSTKIRIKTQNWNRNKGWVRNPKQDRLMREVDQRLKTIRDTVDGKIYSLENEGRLNKDNLREELDYQFGRKTRQKKETFFSYCDRFLDYTLKNQYKSTYNKRKTAIQKLKDFRDARGDFDFEDIDYSLYQDFLAYMHEKEYSKNFIGSVIKVWKRVLNVATAEGVNTNLKFREKFFQSFQEEVNNVYLNEEELEYLHGFDFSEWPYLDRTCDRFLIQCFTGLRYGDFAALEKANINEGLIIQDMMKEDGRVVLPIHWIVQEILEKYNYDLPEPISNAKMNKYLKIMAETAGFNQEVIKMRTTGGKKKREKFKKHELITTHTARRSMATNMYKAGIDVYTIMNITGHKSIDVFLNYVKVTNEDIAERLRHHPFFQKP